MKSFIVNYIIINYLLCERTYTEMTNVIISGRLSHSSDSESVFATLKILLNKLLIISSLIFLLNYLNMTFLILY